jgi:hypothetical protein
LAQFHGRVYFNRYSCHTSDHYKILALEYLIYIQNTFFVFPGKITKNSVRGINGDVLQNRSSQRDIDGHGISVYFFNVRAVNHLILLKQWTTTPYHPSLDIETDTETSMQRETKRLGQIIPLKREVPQKSLGSHHFELVCRRTVRGSITILKKLWTEEIEDEM